MQTTYQNRHVFKPILEKDIMSNYIEVETTYKGKKYILNVSYVQGHFYINVTPFLAKRKFEAWKASPDGALEISRIDAKVKPYQTIYMFKSSGTWIAKDLFLQYGDWLGKNIQKSDKVSDLIGFGTHFVGSISNDYNKATKTKNPYFLKLKNGFVRVNRENNYIILTDIMNLTDKTVKKFHKSTTAVE